MSTSPPPQSLDRAEELAEEIRAAPGPNRAWPRITTILEKFDERAPLTAALGARLDRALAAHGLESEPDLASLAGQSHGTVCLSLAEDGESPANRADVIRVTRWCPGQVPERLSLEAAKGNQDGVLWVDVDLLRADLGDLVETLPQLCAGLGRNMITDLFLVDLQSGVKRFRRGIQALAAFSVRAASTAHGDDSERAISELAANAPIHALGFTVVEFVASENWLVTGWHREHIYRGAEEDAAAGAVPDHRQIEHDVADAWRAFTSTPGDPTKAGSESREHELTTAGDLGLLILRELAGTYPEARRELHAWLELWELQFYKQCAAEGDSEDSDIDRQTLIEVRSLASLFRTWLSPLNPPREKASGFWFPAVTNQHLASRVDELIDLSLRDLKELGDMLRGGFDLVQLQMSQIQARRTEKLQEKFEIIASLLLVPTLIAGLFGANTALPGGNDAHDWTGFLIMVGAMVIGAVATYWLIQLFKRSDRAT